MFLLWLFWRATLVPVCSHVLHNGHPLPFVAPPWLLRCVGSAQSTPPLILSHAVWWLLPHVCGVPCVSPLCRYSLAVAACCVVCCVVVFARHPFSGFVVGWLVCACVCWSDGPLVEGPALLLHILPYAGLCALLLSAHVDTVLWCKSGLPVRLPDQLVCSCCPLKCVLVLRLVPLVAGVFVQGCCCCMLPSPQLFFGARWSLACVRC